MKTLYNNSHSFLSLFLFKETESSILEAEPLVGTGVGAALFLASKKGNCIATFGIVIRFWETAHPPLP